MAILAGADATVAVRLFAAMLGIQVAIGALNDVVDAPRDALSKPRKPIPAGLVSARLGTLVAGGGAVAGLGLSGVSGVATLAAGTGCLALGWLYDLRLSRTRLSWLPLAIALPLLPIHAWLGATAVLPASLLGLIPIGMLAGAGLALANAIVDVDRDALTRRAATVVRLGRRRAWLLQTALLTVAAGLALTLAPSGSTGAGVGELGAALSAVRNGGLVLGCIGLGLGAFVLSSGRAGHRERGWELEALGVVALGIGWLAGTSTLGDG